jgi:hypothetical protein
MRRRSESSAGTGYPLTRGRIGITSKLRRLTPCLGPRGRGNYYLAGSRPVILGSLIQKCVYPAEPRAIPVRIHPAAVCWNLWDQPTKPNREPGALSQDFGVRRSVFTNQLCHRLRIKCGTYYIPIAGDVLRMYRRWIFSGFTTELDPVPI